MCVPAQITPFGHGTGGRAGNQVAAHIGGRRDFLTAPRAPRTIRRGSPREELMSGQARHDGGGLALPHVLEWGNGGGHLRRHHAFHPTRDR
jgi:hypothetical protein